MRLTRRAVHNLNIFPPLSRPPQGPSGKKTSATESNLTWQKMQATRKLQLFEERVSKLSQRVFEGTFLCFEKHFGSGCKKPHTLAEWYAANHSEKDSFKQIMCKKKDAHSPFQCKDLHPGDIKRGVDRLICENEKPLITQDLSGLKHWALMNGNKV